MPWPFPSSAAASGLAGAPGAATPLGTGDASGRAGSNPLAASSAPINDAISCSASARRGLASQALLVVGRTALTGEGNGSSTGWNFPDCDAASSITRAISRSGSLSRLRVAGTGPDGLSRFAVSADAPSSSGGSPALRVMSAIVAGTITNRKHPRHALAQNALAVYF